MLCILMRNSRSIVCNLGDPGKSHPTLKVLPFTVLSNVSRFLLEEEYRVVTNSFGDVRHLSEINSVNCMW